VERAAVRLSNIMDGATAEDVPPVVARKWACFSPSYLGEADPHFQRQDARTERRVQEASGNLVRASQVESTQVHASTRRAYYVQTASWWSALEVPFGFPARMPRIVAFLGTALRRGESTPAAAILATQWVLDVAGVWYDSHVLRDTFGICQSQWWAAWWGSASPTWPRGRAWTRMRTSASFWTSTSRWTGRLPGPASLAEFAGRRARHLGRLSTAKNAWWPGANASVRAWVTLTTSMLRG